MGDIRVAELKENTEFATDLMLDRLFIICPAKCLITASTIAALKEWGFLNIQTSEKSIVTSLPTTVAPPPKPAKEPLSKRISAATELIGRPEYMEQATIDPDVKLALDKIKEKDSSSEKSKMEEAQEIYNIYSQYIKKVYTRYATHKDFNKGEITATVAELINLIKERQRFILRVTPPLEDRNKNFLVNHGLRSTILAITIGLQVKMPQNKLEELAIACILHEIGMLRLPPQLYMSDRTLTLAEKSQMLTHPIIGFNILKENDFPLSIQLAVLDHHEREDGSGYPRHSDGSKISQYGKIIAVACSFEAITAPRHFKEARTTFEAMIEMLRNENHQYDDIILKALLYSLSLYPIGAYVYLSNGKNAQVIDVNPNDPKNPIVQVIGEKNEDGSPITISTDEKNIKIVRVMNKEESQDLVKTLGNGNL